MKKLSFLSSALLVAGLLFVPVASVSAATLTCDSTTGVAGNGECRITTLHNLGVGGLVTVDRALRINGGEIRVNPNVTLNLQIDGKVTIGPNDYGLIIENGGKITGNSAGANGAAAMGATLNITVAAGDVVLAASGATISAANTAGAGCGTGRGGVINITANGANAEILTEDNTLISVNGDTCSAGAITISAPNLGSIDIDGDVLSESLRSGAGTANSNANPPVGGTQPPGGGPIFITASCDLTVSDTGLISSKGRDPGADLVHLQGGCDVLINGLVQSTGIGHAPPGNPPNSCSNVIPHVGSVRRNPATRPGKPFNSAACVEVWAGNILTINKTADGDNGQINADTGGPGGSTGESWIDLFARGDIRILNTTAQWAVHANGNAGTDNGGVVTVKTQGTGPTASPGNIILNGLALQASAASHGSGGTVDVQSTLLVDLRAFNVSNTDGSVQAKGGNGAPADDGGHIILFSQTNIEAGALSNLNVIGQPNTAPDTGVVDLQACGTIAFPPGTITPAGATVNKTPGVCPPTVTFPSVAAGAYDVVLPLCACQAGPGDVDCEKAAVNSVLEPATGRFEGNFGPDVIVRLDQPGATVQDAVDNVTNTNGDSYLIILVVKDGSGQLGGHTSENVVISKAYDLRFALIACSVTINAANAALPAGHIETTASSPAGSAENIFVMDLHGADSNAYGWLVEGNGRYMRNVANFDNRTGIAFIGNGNVMHNGTAIDNGVGMTIAGNSNVAQDTKLFGNAGAGAVVTGNSNVLSKLDVGDRGKGNGSGVAVTGNSNQVLELDVFANGGVGIAVTGNSNIIKKNNVGEDGKSNSGDGIRIAGAGNQVLENEANANTGNGFDIAGGIAGSPNVLKKNAAGDRGQGNGGNGFFAHGDLGNGIANPIELEENEALANGLNGFRIDSAGHQLKKNVGGGSGTGYGNVGCEFNVVAGNFNGTGNKANNLAIGGANNSAFPVGCTGP